MENRLIHENILAADLSHLDFGSMRWSPLWISSLMWILRELKDEKAGGNL